MVYLNVDIRWIVHFFYNNAFHLWVWWFSKCATTKLYKKAKKIAIQNCSIVFWQFTCGTCVTSMDKYCKLGSWMPQMIIVHNFHHFLTIVFERANSNLHWKIITNQCKVRISKDFLELGPHALEIIIHECFDKNHKCKKWIHKCLYVVWHVFLHDYFLHMWPTLIITKF
jgi:hypothetical protein